MSHRYAQLSDGRRRISSSNVAELVGFSAASCMRRVNKLRSDGVIVADISLVDPKARRRFQARDACGQRGYPVLMVRGAANFCPDSDSGGRRGL